MQFINGFTAGSGNFTTNGGTVTWRRGRSHRIPQFLDRGHRHLRHQWHCPDATRGITRFTDNATAATGNFITNGGTAVRGTGGITRYSGVATRATGRSRPMAAPCFYAPRVA